MKNAEDTFQAIVEALETIDLVAAPSRGSLKFQELELDGPNELLVRLGIDDARKISIWLKSTGTSATKNIFWESTGIKATELVSDSGSSFTWVVVDADDVYSRDLLASLAQSIIRKYLTGHGTAKSKVGAALDEWSELFLKNKAGLDAQMLSGLIGELLTLRDIALKCGPDSINTWQGFEGERHDFRHGSNALEVKVTAKLENTISINGATQLEAPHDGRLSLRFIRLEKTPSGQVHLPGLLNELANLGVSKTTLEENILKLGAKPNDLSDTSRAFTLVHSAYFVIREGFPRIIPQSFIHGKTPEGISGLKYKVDLSLAAEFALGDDETDQLLSSFK